MSINIYEMVTNNIIARLESVNPADYKTPWFNLGRDPINLEGKAYRGINRLLLAGIGGDKPIFGTYKSWQGKKCQVKKGEKATPVVFWKFFKEGETQEDGSAAAGGGEIKAVLVRYYNVFSAGQVEGDYAQELIDKQKAKLKEHGRIENAESLIKNYLDSALLKVKESDRACYVPDSLTGERIEMPGKGQFFDLDKYYSVFFHEMVHSTAHEKRLKRDLSGRFGSAAYAFEELIAELGAAMLCGSLGIEQTPHDDHARYIASWLQCLRKDSRAIFTAASMAQKAADYITSTMQKEGA